MGKPIAEAREEMEDVVEKDNFLQIVHDSLQQQTFGNSVVMRHPLGVVGIMSPWNFPVDKILLLALPSLASGNTGKTILNSIQYFTINLFGILSSVLNFSIQIK